MFLPEFPLLKVRCNIHHKHLNSPCCWGLSKIGFNDLCSTFVGVTESRKIWMGRRFLWIIASPWQIVVIGSIDHLFQRTFPNFMKFLVFEKEMVVLLWWNLWIVDHSPTYCVNNITLLYHKKVYRKGEKMHTALILGYSTFDLGLFNLQRIPRLKLLKKPSVETGKYSRRRVTWLYFTGNPWALNTGLRGRLEMKERLWFQVGHHFWILNPWWKIEMKATEWNWVGLSRLTWIKYAYPENR